MTPRQLVTQALERDAARYRWLRERPSFIGWDWWTPRVPNDVNITPEFMDRAIDIQILASAAPHNDEALLP